MIGDEDRESRVYLDLVFFPLRFRGVTNVYWEWVGGENNRPLAEG